MEDIIQQLKDNDKAFGRMSEEMQEKSLEIGFHGHFRLYVYPGFGGVITNPSYKHEGHLTYRLRADYEDEPEIEECEICLKKPGNYLYYVLNGDEVRLSKMIDNPHWKGLKYKNGMVRPDTIAYLPGDNYEGVHHRTEIKGLVSGEITVLRATHVLFRRKKQE